MARTRDGGDVMSTGELRDPFGLGMAFEPWDMRDLNALLTFAHIRTPPFPQPLREP